MRVKFSLRFRYGEVIWYNKDHWQRFLVDDILRCLIDFTEVKEFQCDFNEKERTWVSKIAIPPMTTETFLSKMKLAIEKYYHRRDVEISVSEMKLEKKEVGQFTTALVMKKIEGS